MKVLFITPYYDPRLAPAATLDAFPILRELPAELAARGHSVRVLALASSTARVERAGVRYQFLRPPAPARALASALQRWKPRYGAAYYEVTPRLARDIAALRPDVVHVFGVTLDWQLALLARASARQGVPLVAHYHGGLPELGRYRRLQAHNLRRVARVLFTAPEQAEPWLAAGLLRPEQVALLPETSSPWRGLPRDAARAKTGIVGDPACLSAGRLAPIKDPLTMLRGFARAAATLPDARLYLYYLTDELLPELQAFVAATPGLAERVEFRGRAAPEEMQALYSSADVLLQASLREWSGLALLEALSCGCVPVVSDIPAFRALTDDGRVARLFPVGDDEALADALVKLDTATRARLANDGRDFFTRELSFAALARRLEALYATLPPARYNRTDGD